MDPLFSFVFAVAFRFWNRVWCLGDTVGQLRTDGEKVAGMKMKTAGTIRENAPTPFANRNTCHPFRW
jgi:hypothetical protein